MKPSFLLVNVLETGPLLKCNIFWKFDLKSKIKTIKLLTDQDYSKLISTKFAWVTYSKEYSASFKEHFEYSFQWELTLLRNHLPNCLRNYVTQKNSK